MVKQVVNDLMIPHLLTTAEDAPDKNPAWIRYVWQQARQAMRLNNYPEFLLVIDEIHKLDNWSEVVKAEWDADSMRDVNIKVVLLGSSRLLIKDGLNESLAGRYELIEMEHWSYNEMRESCLDEDYRPRYVLIIGEGTIIPFSAGSSNDPDDPLTDMYYACLDSLTK